MQVVAIANDITFNSGAFGPREDAMFRAVTEYALQQKLPLVYLAANSGARVGLANEVKQCLQVILHQPLYLAVSVPDGLAPAERQRYMVLKSTRFLAKPNSACTKAHPKPDLPTACSLPFCSITHMPCRGCIVCM